MNDLVDNFADQIYLAIELECEGCQRRFDAPEDCRCESEAEIRRWADKTAEAARQVGWRLVGDKILCPNCVTKPAAIGLGPEG